MFYSIFFDYAQRVLARILRILIVRESPRTVIPYPVQCNTVSSLIMTQTRIQEKILSVNFWNYKPSQRSRTHRY